MTDLEALVVAAYVFADDYPVPARGGRRPLISDAELVALSVAQAAIGISSDRQFLGLIGRLLPGWFPHLPEQSQYNRRLRGLVELISIVQQHLARLLDSGGARLSDGTLIDVAGYPGCAQHSAFAGFARYGFAKSQHRFVYGVRLVLLTDLCGLPLGYTIVAANEKEYEPLADLLSGTPPRLWSPTRASGAATTPPAWPQPAPPCSPQTRPALPPTSPASGRSPRHDSSSRASSRT